MMTIHSFSSDEKPKQHILRHTLRHTFASHWCVTRSRAASLWSEMQTIVKEADVACKFLWTFAHFIIQSLKVNWQTWDSFTFIHNEHKDEERSPKNGVIPLLPLPKTSKDKIVSFKLD